MKQVLAAELVVWAFRRRAWLRRFSYRRQTWQLLRLVG